MMRALHAYEDAAEWDATIKRLQVQDVHFTSAYARVQTRAGGSALLLVEENSGCTIAQPFWCLPIGNGKFCDFRSLYGFGGPLCNVAGLDVPTLGRMFADEVTAWARKCGIVTEYCCLHPLFAKEQLPLLRHENTQFTKNVVVIDDLATFDESRVSRRVRRACKAARDRCIIFRHDHAETFHKLYIDSMDRLDAGLRWRYDLAYWDAHLREDVGAQFFYLVEGHEPRRALLVIGKPPTAYAHFLGSDGEERNAGFDDILYFDVAKLLGKQGFTRFHLGGGTTIDEQDPLLKFKMSFSDSLYSVGSYTRVFQPEIYDKLCESAPTASSAVWFPPYRAPELV